MVSEPHNFGLIVSTSAHCSAPLDDLIACCDWPVLLAANARRLQQVFDRQLHDCVLFWLEARQQVTPTAKLVEWMRERQRETYRVAVAYRLDCDVEAALRTAGVHCYLPACGDIIGLVEDALWSMLDGEYRPTTENPPPSFGTVNPRRASQDAGIFPKQNRPP